MDKLLDPLREDKSSLIYARETAALLRELIESKFEENLTFESINETIQYIKKTQKLLTAAHPLEFSIANIIRRVLSIIREQAKLCRFDLNVEQEDRFIKKGVSFKYDQTNIPVADLANADEKKSPSAASMLEFKTNVFGALEDLILECDNLSANINESAFNHISTNETIITFGYSASVASYLIEASKKRTFEVIVTQNSIDNSGEKMARTLASGKINTMLIPDTAVYAIMSRVDKAIIGAHAIMANGGILGSSGGLLLAMAAKAHLVPLIIIAGAYKLTPNFPFEQDTYNELINPGILFDRIQGEKANNVSVIVPSLDYISPEYISLYVTNFGEHTPSYLYRLFAEYYMKE